MDTFISDLRVNILTLCLLGVNKQNQGKEENEKRVSVLEVHVPHDLYDLKVARGRKQAREPLQRILVGRDSLGVEERA